MADTVYTVYLNRDNTFIVQLLEDGDPKLLGSVTKVEIMYKGEYYDSDAYSGDEFDWSIGLGKIQMQLGGLPLEAGKDRKTEVIIYDGTNPNGIVWDLIILRVIDLDA